MAGKKASFHEFLEMLEKTWNKSARAYVEKERLKIDPNSFRITAQVDYKNERGITARIQAGPVNQIFIIFPSKNYSRTIQKVLDYISNPRVHKDEDLEEQRFVGSVVHELFTNAVWKRKNKNGRNRHWKKVSATKSWLVTRRRDNSDYVAEVEVVNTVKVRHKGTGLSTILVDKEGREVWDMLQEAYQNTFRKVHEYMEEEEEKKAQDKSPKFYLVPVADIVKARFMIERVLQYE